MVNSGFPAQRAKTSTLRRSALPSVGVGVVPGVAVAVVVGASVAVAIENPPKQQQTPLLELKLARKQTNPEPHGTRVEQANPSPA